MVTIPVGQTLSPQIEILCPTERRVMLASCLPLVWRYVLSCLPSPETYLLDLEHITELARSHVCFFFIIKSEIGIVSLLNANAISSSVGTLLSLP